MEMLQISTACNVVIDVSLKMDFMDTNSLCVAVTARTEQYLQTQGVLAEAPNLDAKFLRVGLAESGVLAGSQLRSAETFERLVSLLRSEEAVFDELRRLWRIDRSQNRQILSINLSRLVAFIDFHPSCRVAVLKALHKMASSRPKLAAIRSESEDITFLQRHPFCWASFVTRGRRALCINTPGLSFAKERRPSQNKFGLPQSQTAPRKSR